MGRTATIFLAVTLCATLANATSPADPLNVFNNMAQELADCAAYFGVISIALENSNDYKGASDYKEQMDKALGHAAVITQEAGLIPETISARFKMAMENMTKRIAGNTSNISILMADYSELCIEVMTDPKKRSRYWAERKFRGSEDELEQSR